MRAAISACFALVLLAGNTGCCLFCKPLFPCLHRHQCKECCGMGCERAPIFNWSRCCDTCDHCGDWTGQSIVARTGFSEQGAYVTANRNRNPKMAMTDRSERVVPGSYREVTRVNDSADEDEVDQVVEEEPEVIAEAPRPKKVRSTKPRSRHQVVRVQRFQEE